MIARLESDAGLTLIETVIATSMLLVAMVGLLSMAALATAYTENHGHLEARTTEYAQDKMEQLLAMAYTDTVSDSVVFPAAVTGSGTGLDIGGSLATNTAGYVDWLAYDGSLLGGGTSVPTDWFYKRMWQVECATATCSNNPAVGIKRITVTTTVKTSIGKRIIPTSTVVALKASQF